MNIFIIMKSPAKTRNLEKVKYEIKNYETLRALIVNLVNIEVDKYEKKNELKVLSQEEIDGLCNSGKISFGFGFREKSKVDRDKAERIAIQSFIDGVVRIFINDNEVVDLDSKLDIKENDEITIIRLTMLAGRLF